MLPSSPQRERTFKAHRTEIMIRTAKQKRKREWNIPFPLQRERETIRVKLPRSRPVTSAVEISQLSFPLFDVLRWWHKGDCRRRRCVECRSAVSLVHPRTTPSRVPECHRRCVVARPAVIKFPSRRGKLGNSIFGAFWEDCLDDVERGRVILIKGHFWMWFCG